MRFYTVGYGGRSPAEFVRLLRENGVRTVVDVRLRPDRASMGAFVRAKTSDKGIERLLSEHGIGYRSLIELGNVFLDSADWRAPYAELLAGSGRLLTARLDEVPGPFALLCAEKRVADCHRGLIADHLTESRGWHAEHIE
jgi:uncharacterized protein (DUF488 family)